MLWQEEGSLEKNKEFYSNFSKIFPVFERFSTPLKSLPIFVQIPHAGYTTVSGNIGNTVSGNKDNGSKVFP